MNKNLKKTICILLSAVLLAVLVCGCGKVPAAENSSQETTAVTTVPARQVKDGIQTLLVICLDAFDAPSDSGAYRNGNRADLIMLIVIDEALGKTTALQLNPDTMVPFTPPGAYEALEVPLGLVYSYGSGGSDSCLSGSKAVSGLLGGIPIDHYMTFTMDSIPIVNDMIGGVTVDITDAFPEEYPALQKGENVPLSGESAAAFFRFRADDDVDNEAHMERQRGYMAGLYSPFLKNAGQENFLTKLTLQLGERFTTDLTLSQMMQMLQSLETYPLDENILTLRGTAETSDGQFRFHADTDSLNQTAERLFFE